AVPTGSSDPFALRRAALGIVKIILEEQLPLSLSAAISAAAKGLREYAPKIEPPEVVERQVMDFILERARFILREQHGFAYDEINAAFGAGADNLVDAMDRVAAVKAVRNTRNFAPLAAAFKRICNILEKSASKGDKVQGAAKPELLREHAEKELFEAARRVGEKAALLKKTKHYREALETISALRPAIDLFFDKILVMVEEVDIRRNRIALLGSLLREFSTIADFSELAIEGKR
ncbi:MAG: glycine--tRNA ligase subunit beta, partial [Blastocatellia bacterium]